ncbi:exodeoxyribonuclease V subunit beta [Ammoniphilus sp. CFH 90114]|uniref:UvrD-helicase domain-containing protein n=1 Tax=Ammoniphilus sp. CFH 90114 TaxID=2493665 RepID=UPI00100E13FB|nr:UvrD-helicase domain-containing protein [Ammoniphilus sp. CFH 90114]RXT15386.1 hypothetical protein EIZ39_04075 [Ammoniphilus sp. CFH 90114]
MISISETKRRQLEVEGFNPEQTAAVLSEESLIVISAGAGSGKTRVLTERYVYICERRLQSLLNGQDDPLSADVEQMVAITFTKKAAREMRERIRKTLEKKKKEALQTFSGNERIVADRFWSDQLEGLGNAVITTFHSFCQKLIQDYSLEAKVLPTFSILDEVESKLLQADILDSMFDEEVWYKDWQPIYSFFNEHTLKKSIQEIYGQLRELDEAVDPVDFFNQAKIVDELIQLELTEKHRKLKDFYKDAQNYIAPLQELLEEYSKKKTSSNTPAHIHRIMNYLLSLPDSMEPQLENFQEIEKVMPTLAGAWKKSAPALYDLVKYGFGPLKEFWKENPGLRDHTLEDLKMIVRIFGQMMQEFHVRYELVKRERAVMDFSDLQRRAVAVLANEKVGQDCRRKFKHFMIDEFQDTNALQMNMLKRIGPEFQFIVGDGKQAIYRFRGGDVSLMKDYVHLAKASGSDSSFIDMSSNYRTCKGIIDFVNLSFSSIMGTQETEVPYQIHYSPLVAARDSEQEQEVRVELLQTVLADDTTVNEYEALVSRMMDMMEEKQPEVQINGQWTAPEWKNMAILIPSRTQLMQLEMALQNRNIPFVVYGGVGFFEKQEVMDYLAFLSWLNRPWEALYIMAILRGPLFGLSMNDFLEMNEHRTDMELSDFLYKGYFRDAGLSSKLRGKLEEFYLLFEKWIPYVSHTSVKETLLHWFEESGLKITCLLQSNSLQRIRNVEKLIHILADLKAHSLDHMLKQVKRLIELSEKEGEAEVELDEGNVVHIMTVHASKGLEFPIVFVPNLGKNLQSDRGSLRFHKQHRLLVKYNKDHELRPHEENTFCTPMFAEINKELKNQALEESKRLFYVAATRARDYLVFSSLHKEKEDSDETDKTWYQMLMTAIDEVPGLGDKVRICTNERNEKKADVLVLDYAGPTLRIGRELSLTFSVSEVMDFINDPTAYYYKHVLKLDTVEWEGELHSFAMEKEPQAWSSAELGSIVHRACELLDQGWSRGIALQEALSRLEDAENSYLYIAQVERFMNDYQSIDQGFLGVPMENEWSFTYHYHGIHVVGTIDKVVRRESGIHLIDIKTNQTINRDQLVQRYLPQLYLYKLAYEQVKGASVAGLSLFFLRDRENGLVEIPFDPNYEQFVIFTLERMAELKRKNANRSEYTKL